MNKNFQHVCSFKKATNLFDLSKHIFKAVPLEKGS